jgi:hypothetical protein
MLTLQHIVLLGLIATLIGGFSYIRGTLRGTTKPNRVSWLLWAAVPMIATFAGLADGATWALLPVFMAGFIPFLIFLFSFANKNAYWKLNTLDYACGAFSIFALLFWALTSEARIAIIFAIIADALASVPTIVKAWRNPETESGGPFFGGTVSQLTGLVAAQTWAFTEVGFTIYLISINAIILFSIYRRKLLK